MVTVVPEEGVAAELADSVTSEGWGLALTRSATSVGMAAGTLGASVTEGATLESPGRRLRRTAEYNLLREKFFAGC